ncbi:hypothetical protein [Roseomonas sp. BN140053]|uniref:hypothetical protein n=1 Tax=Roseomonas sp. BN140053 TaxID=3391898 RepID=UPI0039E93744
MKAADFDAHLARLVIKRLPPLQRQVLLALPGDGSPGEVSGFRPQVSASCMRAVKLQAGVTVELVEEVQLSGYVRGKLQPARCRLTEMGRKVQAQLRAQAVAA